MQEQAWLPLMRSSGSTTLGEAILRLASLAEAAHRQQARDAQLMFDVNDSEAGGPAPGNVVVAHDTDRPRTEMDQ